MIKKLRNGQILLIEHLGSFTAALTSFPPEKFVALIPAFEEDEESVAEIVARAAMDRGCVEICCVGPRAEFVHDLIDWIVVEKEALHVVTTWHEDEAEGCEYFFLTAANQMLDLLAFTNDSASLESSFCAALAKRI